MITTGYEIPFEKATAAKNLVGKTLAGNGNEIKILDWVGQNYKLQMPNGDIKETPVMWVLQSITKNKINIKG